MVNQQRSNTWVQPGASPGCERTLCILTETAIHIYPFVCDLPTARDLKEALQQAVNLWAERENPKPAPPQEPCAAQPA